MDNELTDQIYFQGLVAQTWGQKGSVKVARVVVTSCLGRVWFTSKWMDPLSKDFKDTLSRWINYPGCDLEFKYINAKVCGDRLQ